VSQDDVPEDERERELAIFEAQADESKPPEVRKKIAEGRLRKWLEEHVLLDQQHVNADKHDGRTIEELRAGLSSRTGENIVIKRFARFAVGD
jgi:elongation factor Ts